MVDPAKMSVEEIIAACRAADGSGEKPSTAADETSAEKVVSEAPSAPAVESPAALASKEPSKKASEMTVAEMLAAARGEKQGGSPADSKKISPAKKAVAKAVPKASPEVPAKPARPGPMDTSSVLAAARKSGKPGPITKAEAAAAGKPTGTKSKAMVPPMPAKPGYAKQKSVDAPAADRRGFMEVFFGSFLAVGFTSLGAVHSLWGLGLARFMFPNILTEPPNQFKVGFPDNFSPGSVDAQFKAQFGVWVVNSEYEGVQQIVALRTVCTHLGCTPNWLEAEQKFKCPCHGSGFYKDGINFEGPAPRPLERYAVRLADDGQLEIDKSKMFQQEMGQWSDPASFVPV